MKNYNNFLPLVSIILPTYNRAEYIKRAVASVRTQDYTNWELIIWDDGSYDHTKELVEAIHDSRIRYYFSSNHGPAYARNQAIARSRGEFIAFLDSDDEWLENKLALQVSFLLANPEIDIVFCDFENIDIERKTRTNWFEYSSRSLRYNRVRPCGADFIEIIEGFPQSLLITNYIGLPTVVLRANWINQMTTPFNESLRNSEDLELWWRLGLLSCRIAYSENILLRRYRLSAGLARPNVAYWRNFIHALAQCAKVVPKRDYRTTKRLLRGKQQHAWLKLTLCMKEEKHSYTSVIFAYCKSIRYGISKDTIVILVELIFGMRIRQILQLFYRKM